MRRNLQKRPKERPKQRLKNSSRDQSVSDGSTRHATYDFGKIQSSRSVMISQSGNNSVICFLESNRVKWIVLLTFFLRRFLDPAPGRMLAQHFSPNRNWQAIKKGSQVMRLAQELEAGSSMFSDISQHRAPDRSIEAEPSHQIDPFVSPA